MNPQYPLPNFPFPNYNPTINPNPSFPPPQSHWTPPPPLPPPQLPPPPLPPPPPPQDLSNSLTSLITLLHSSHTTLQSLSSKFPFLSLPPSPPSLIQCPSNPHHWVPPPSLFLHSLHCPTPLDISPTKDQNFVNQTNFVHPLDNTSNEFCFSLDDYVDFNTSFFYKDCPGVVSSFSLSNSIDDGSKRIFSLPSVLSAECGENDVANNGFVGISVKVLPSEVWVVRSEVEQWCDYPNEYSFSVVRGILSVECVRECDLAMWVIENSPRFGVVVDVPMRDHLVVLIRLCLKALVREAVSSYGASLKSEEGDESRGLGLKWLRFGCPVLGEVLRWLASQLSILYGETNAKLFVLGMVKHLLPCAASSALLFPLERSLIQAFGSGEESSVVSGRSSGEVAENDGNDGMCEKLFSRPIFVYQIAAAIAALHERSRIEERIRRLRSPFQLPAYQRSAEHSHFSSKADEERQKRPDYRPLIEHDSLLNQRHHNQGNNKPKTKEELLAEERDYKRRRMSYRGKKLRSTKEVMRDIIEDYMEAIKQTGGIGGLTKEDSGGPAPTSTNSFAPDASNPKLGSRNNKQDGYRTQLNDDHNSRHTDPINSSGRSERPRKESYNHGHSEDQRTTSRKRHGRDYYSRSPSKDRSRGQSRESRSYYRNRGVSETSEDERPSSSHINHKSLSTTSSSLRVSSGRKDKKKLESPDRQRRKKREYDKSKSFDRVEINDRYDPSEANDYYDDDHYESSKYTRPESKNNYS